MLLITILIYNIVKSYKILFYKINVTQITFLCDFPEIQAKIEKQRLIYRKKKYIHLKHTQRKQHCIVHRSKEDAKMSQIDYEMK